MAHLKSGVLIVLTFIFLVLASAGVQHMAIGARQGEEPERTTAESGTAPSQTDAEPPIALPMSVYILDAGDPSLSSQRSIAQVESILVEVNQIWSPAGITLDAINIQRLLLPNDILQELLRGNLNAFLNGIGREFEVPDPAEINLFYARSLGGPNGIAPYGGRALFVADQPTVEHARVTSHEIGHALGLHHDRRDREQLMFSGTNGVNLSAVEISTARYIAAGILAGVR